MAQETLQKQAQTPHQTRDLDPNVHQRIAANPEASVWVSASAGTGKTKVLTDRVLRLLLPRSNGQPGTRPHKILCLTFTKSAASEMALRINDTLGRWAACDQEELHSELKILRGLDPEPKDLQAARKLFADVVDTPGGLKIMTIHSFCQSVLGRFPLEAGLPPYFKVLEETDAGQMLAKAQDLVFKKSAAEKASPLNRALQNVAETINEDQFFQLLKDVISERHQLQRLLEKHFGEDGLYASLCETLNVVPDASPQEILLEDCQDEAFDKSTLLRVVETLSKSAIKTDQGNAALLGRWLHALPAERCVLFESYASVFFTQKAEIKKKLAGKDVQERMPEILDIMIREAERLQAVQESMKAAVCAGLTRDLLILGQEIIDSYQALKMQQACFDFDDLIFMTLDLLQGRTDKTGQDNATSWVLYKLDEGLDHILIDEAQDTNPEQWKIVEALCADFFSGAAASDVTRTVFTVGDEKQSIYSFQRASPEEFNRMQNHFADKVRQAGENWDAVNLNISFRSTRSVLQAVDAVFAQSALQKGLSLHKILHHSYRSGQAGLVELWPLLETQKSEEIDPWTPPTKIIEAPSGASLLAAHIAKTIKNWLDQKELLESQNRPIEAGDIMILTRTRTSFVSQLTRMLKAQNIPVTGSDRMILNDQLVVQDLNAFAEFALLPDDDLSLACIFKSPLIGFDEEQLFEIAANRAGSLWSALKSSPHKDVIAYLSKLINLAAVAHPYEFFSNLLQTPCPGNQTSGLKAIKTRLGDEILDPLDEFLNAALQFENDHIASLQEFLRWQTSEQSQIKRELEGQGDKVRIMTVHGAKGLQAPIVILPDTIRTTIQIPGQSDKRLVWPDKSGLKIPIWSPRKEFDCGLFKTAFAKLDERLDEEYRRLLYVAMTRAEDRLYVAGYKALKEPLENSWYYFVKAGLESLKDVEKLEDGRLRLYNPQVRDVAAAATKEQAIIKNPAMPDFLQKEAPTETAESITYNPSRLSGNKSPVSSPLQSQNTYRFARGIVTHKLLELLPESPRKKWEKLAETFLEHYGRDFTKDVQKKIVEETLAILNHPEFAPVFQKGSLSEVALGGLMPGNKRMSGQIDRLLITNTDIWIIDYKTNRAPPQGPEDMPAAYKSQMRAYEEALSQIYPGRKIHSALLWTDGPVLMPLAQDCV